MWFFSYYLTKLQNSISFNYTFNCLNCILSSCPGNNLFRKDRRLAPSGSFVASPVLLPPIVGYWIRRKRQTKKKRRDLSFGSGSTKTQTKLIRLINLPWDLEEEWQNSRWKHKQWLNLFRSAVSIFKQQYTTTLLCYHPAHSFCHVQEMVRSWLKVLCFPCDPAPGEGALEIDWGR